MPNDKYLVIKKTDMAALFKQYNGPMDEALLREVTDLELPDAEVIRHQDIASPQMFHHYSSVMRTFMELASRFQIPGVDINRLDEIADHFHQAALTAEAVEHKFPD